MNNLIFTKHRRHRTPLQNGYVTLFWNEFEDAGTINLKCISLLIKAKTHNGRQSDISIFTNKPLEVEGNLAFIIKSLGIEFVV